MTEAGILYQMQRENPQKRFIPAPPVDSTCGCNNCAFMKMVTLEKICSALEREAPEVIIDEEVRPGVRKVRSAACCRSAEANNSNNEKKRTRRKYETVYRAVPGFVGRACRESGPTRGCGCFPTYRS